MECHEVGIPTLGDKLVDPKSVPIVDCQLPIN